jgi:hypothetical protein
MVVPSWTCSAGHKSHQEEGSNIGRAEHLSLHLLGLSTLSQGTFLPVPTCIFASVLELMSEYIVAILPEKLQLSAHHCSTSRTSTSAWFQHCFDSDPSLFYFWNLNLSVVLALPCLRQKLWNNVCDPMLSNSSYHPIAQKDMLSHCLATHPPLRFLVMIYISFH